jgi:hypothetical protein
MKMNKTVAQVLQAVGLAMGVVVIVLSILGTVPTDTLVMLLGFGLFALGVNAVSGDGG